MQHNSSGHFCLQEMNAGNTVDVCGVCTIHPAIFCNSHQLMATRLQTYRDEMASPAEEEAEEEEEEKKNKD